MEARGRFRGRLSARYWRLRFASDIATRRAEYDDARGERDHDYDEDDGWYWGREWDQQFDGLIVALQRRIRAVRPFNPLPLSIASSGCDPARPLVRDPAAIEQRLVDHLERLLSSSDPAWLLAGEAETDLARIDQIAESHFDGCLDSLLGLVLVRSFWIRPLTNWIAPPGGSHRQLLASLVEHLLVEFRAPLWLGQVDAGSPSAAMLRPLMWLIALGQGGSLRRLIELAGVRWPAQWRPIASKLVAALARVPDAGTPTRGIMFAEILRLGGSELELRWLEHAGLVVDPSAGEVDEAELEFWRQTVAWLIRHRARIDEDDAAMILAWARHMQTEGRRRGGGFDWRGRTFDSARRDAETYRRSLAGPGVRWLCWRAKGWNWEGRFAEQDWTIHELTSSEALRAESLAMAHCVRLYDIACFGGHSAIFSLMQGTSRRVTIEINMVDRRVAQAKRARNAEPNELERAVIEHWRRSIVDPER